MSVRHIKGYGYEGPSPKAKAVCLLPAVAVIQFNMVLVALTFIVQMHRTIQIVVFKEAEGDEELFLKALYLDPS